MVMSREKKIWLLAVTASVLFHALLFVCNLSFQSKNMQLSIVVKLVEKQSVHDTRADVVKNEIVKKTLPKKAMAVAQKNSAHKEITQHVLEKAPLKNAETTSQSVNESGHINGNTEANIGVSGAKRNETGSAVEIVDVSALVITKKITPQYPAFSRKRKEEGTVQLLITILDNSVTECKIEKTSGFGRLDEAARRAVLQWKFSHSGTVKARVPIVFKLSD